MNKFTILFFSILVSPLTPSFGNGNPDIHKRVKFESPSHGRLGEFIYQSIQYLKLSPSINQSCLDYNEFLESKVKDAIKKTESSTFLGSIFASKKDCEKQEECFKDESKKLAEEKAIWHQVILETLSPPKPTTLFSTTFNLYDE